MSAAGGWHRRALLGATVSLAAPLRAAGPRPVVDVRQHGAIGDGRTLDSAALQRAIDAAAALGGQVLLPAPFVFLTGPLELRAGIDFHVATGATVRVSDRPEDYAGRPDGVLHARNAAGLTLSGGGTIDGRSPDFMARYDPVDEWWIPKPLRPRLIVLEGCDDLIVRDLHLVRAAFWTLHLVGCRRVLIERLVIANQLDVPNCDGIDPDHCQDVEIRDCHITCGDDAIVIKATAGHEHYGPAARIHVHDCVVRCQDAGIKIGTETVSDITDIVVERCTIVEAARGLCIQLRDGGDVRRVTFRDIRLTARYFSAPWWGRGEAISFTAVPRTPTTRTGTIADVGVERVTGRAENSVRIEGLGGSRVSDVTLAQVDLRLGRWTRYPGGVWDNRPTSAIVPLEPHATPAISVRHADRVTIRDCRIRWLAPVPAGFTVAVEAEDAPGLRIERLDGTAAFPDRLPPTITR